jgi:hypothetical protein
MSDEISITRQSSANTKPSAPTFPTEIIDLPSQGRFYPSNSKLSTGQVEVKLMTAKEEDILTSPNLLKKGLAVEKLIESLIVDKDIDLDQILVGDKNALIFAIRRLAYGDTYGPVEITCPKCSAVNKQNVDLSEINYKEIDFDAYPKGVNEFEYTLPTSKLTIKFKLLTAGDEKMIERDIEGFAKLKKESSSEITTRLKYMITSINGDTDKAKIKSFIDNNMLARDSSAFRQHAKVFSPDVDSRFNFCCTECSNQERVAVPMTVSFFWPNS